MADVPGPKYTTSALLGEHRAHVLDFLNNTLAHYSVNPPTKPLIDEYIRLMGLLRASIASNGSEFEYIGLRTAMSEVFAVLIEEVSKGPEKME